MILVKKNDNIFLNDMPVYFRFFNSGYINNSLVDIQKTDCGFKIEIEGDLPITGAFPVFYRKILVGNNINFIDTKLSSKYHFFQDVSFFKNYTNQKIKAPVIHLVGDKDWSISTPGECIIDVFKSNYEQYVGITGIPNENKKVTFYIDISENYRINLQRFDVKRSTKYFCGDLLSDIEIHESIFHGDSFIKLATDFNEIIKETEQIQNILNQNQVYSIVIGSVAQLLNGMQVVPGDIDLMLRDRPSMVFASELLKDKNYHCTFLSEKLISLEKNNIKIDLTLDNYNLLKNPFYVRQNGNFRFLDENGILWLCLLSLQESVYTKNYYPQNEKALYEITKFCYDHNLPCNTKLTEFFEGNKNKTTRCIKICNILKKMSVNFLDIKVNEPFKVNSFSLEMDHAVSIIGTMEKNDCRLIVPFKCKHCLWESLDAEENDISIEHKNEFSIIFLKQIKTGTLFITDRDVDYEYFRKEYKI